MPSARTTPSTPTGALHLALAAATAGLLGTAHAEGLRTTDWQVDSAVLLYKEGDGRVQAFEPVVSIRRTDSNERSMGLRLTFDTLTGASPNGAVAQPTAQTFTNPSGRGGGYTTPAGAAPLDPRFHDARLAVLGSYERPLGEGQRVSFSGNVSNEHDFTSISFSSSFAQDFNEKNSTLSVGLSAESDRIRPEGGVLAELKPAFGASTRVGSSESRKVFDLLAGYTQVMSRGWLMQASYNLGKGSGYHSDPYKVLSIIDGTTGLLTGDNYVVESRPRSRTRHSLSLLSKWHLTEDVVEASYRYYRDDWGVRAHTLGLKFGMPLAHGQELSLRVESYRQKLKEPGNAPGALQGLQLMPNLRATTLMLGYNLPL